LGGGRAQSDDPEVLNARVSELYQAGKYGEAMRDCRLVEPRSAKQPLMISGSSRIQVEPNGSIQLKPSVTQCF
jgi:hypothetical protein